MKISAKTGYTYNSINHQLKSFFGCKNKRGFELEIEEEECNDDIDFNNDTERKIMEIVEENGTITYEEYLACLQLDIEINIQEIISFQSEEFFIERTKSLELQDLEVQNFNSYEEFCEFSEADPITFELAFYVTTTAAGAFLMVMPPPINMAGRAIAGWSLGKCVEIVVHTYSNQPKN